MNGNVISPKAVISVPFAAVRTLLDSCICNGVHTGEARPVKQPLRRYPAPHVEAISRQVDDMLDQGVIEPACSPWASNLVLVKKSDGSFRCCVDYRTLNSVTHRRLSASQNRYLLGCYGNGKVVLGF